MEAEAVCKYIASTSVIRESTTSALVADSVNCNFSNMLKALGQTLESVFLKIICHKQAQV